MFKELMSTLGGIDAVYFQDLADKMCSEVTVFLIFLMSTLVAYKTYFISPMDCYITNVPSGLNFDKFVTSYCWVDGTLALGDEENTPDPKTWSDSSFKIYYYPWIPIILAMQCALFYLPKVLWKEYCSSKSGTDLKNLIELSIKTSKMSLKSRNEFLTDIAGIIEALFHLHRDNRRGLVSDVKRKISRKIPLLIWGKRSGNGILCVYLIVKLLYISIAFAQFFLMTRLLGLDNSFFSVFCDVFNYIFHGYEWKVTKYFPRVTYCKLKGIRAVGVIDNQYVAQCVLPINILNEKIYIFIFIWMIFLIIFSMVYFLKWAYMVGFPSPKRKLVKIYLERKDIYKTIDESLIKKFIWEFLRLDGIFLLQMIRMHSGDVLTAGITEQLWIIYKTKYQGVDLSNPENSD